MMKDTNKSSAPMQTSIFLSEEDDKWYFYEKYLNEQNEIGYRIHPEGYDRAEDAMLGCTIALNEFANKMKKLQEQIKVVPTFSEQLKSWFRNTFSADSSDAYVVLMAYALFHYLLPNIGQTGEKQLEQVTWKEIEDMIARANGICVSAQPLIYKLLRRFFSDAMMLEQIHSNPMDYVQPYPFNRPIKEFPAYTAEDVRKLLAEAKYTTHLLEICLMLLGLRAGEVRGLRFSDFNEENQTLHVRRQAAKQQAATIKDDGTFSVKKIGTNIKSPKNDTSDRILKVPHHIFLLVRERKHYLDDLKEDRLKKGKPWDDQYEGYISIADFGQLKDENTVAAALKRICSAAAIPNVSPHDLRHIAATLMYEYGAANNPDKEGVLKSVSRYLGHASPNITIDVYMTYVESLSKIRGISETRQDPFLFASKTGGV